MTTKEIKLTETPSVAVESVKADLITPSAPVVTPEEKQAVISHPANRNPSEWRIEVVSDDTIRAVNNTSRDVFEGSIEDFNKILRG